MESKVPLLSPEEAARSIGLTVEFRKTYAVVYGFRSSIVAQLWFEDLMQQGYIAMMIWAVDPLTGAKNAMVLWRL
jgi:hypothetical protein